MELSETQEKILDVAQELAQTRGYNGFSFRDIAERVGIRSPSIHHHFRSKSDLGVALVKRYRRDFEHELLKIDASKSPTPTKLRRYAQLYQGAVQRGRMCLCGMMAAETDTLPDEVRGEVLRFFEAQQHWLSRVFKVGRTEDSLMFAGGPDRVASAYLGLLEGCMMTARVQGQDRAVNAAADIFLQGLAAP